MLLSCALHRQQIDLCYVQCIVPVVSDLFFLRLTQTSPRPQQQACPQCSKDSVSTHPSGSRELGNDGCCRREPCGSYCTGPAGPALPSGSQHIGHPEHDAAVQRPAPPSDIQGSWSCCPPHGAGVQHALFWCWGGLGTPWLHLCLISPPPTLHKPLFTRNPKTYKRCHPR